MCHKLSRLCKKFLCPAISASMYLHKEWYNYEKWNLFFRPELIDRWLFFICIWFSSYLFLFFLLAVLTGKCLLLFYFSMLFMFSWKYASKNQVPFILVYLSIQFQWFDLCYKFQICCQKQCDKYPHMRKGKLQNSLKEIYMFISIFCCAKRFISLYSLLNFKSHSDAFLMSFTEL